jgi:hypothetical protein
MMPNENLPIPVELGGGAEFDAADNANALIRGTRIKCVDGLWSDATGTSFPKGTQMLVIGTGQALQRWKDRKPIETITVQPFPDLDDLNAAIPVNEWELGIDGKPQPPWVHQHIVYLLDPSTGDSYTFISGTWGARIAAASLTSRVKHIRALRGDRVIPLVGLEARPMKTQFGVKQRPEFAISEWRGFSTDRQGNANLIEAKPNPLGKPVKPIAAREELDDDIPF